MGGSIIGATLDNCYASVTNVIAQYTEDKDLFVTGANIKVEATWTMNADLSYSKAKRKNRWAAFRSETYPATMTWDMSGGVTPSLSTSSNPADVNGQSAPSWLTGTADGPDDLKDSLTALQVDFERQFEGDHLKAIKFGARVSNRKKDYLHRHQDYTADLHGHPAGVAVHQLQRHRVRRATAAQWQLQRDRRLRVWRHAGRRQRHRAERHLGRR